MLPYMNDSQKVIHMAIFQFTKKKEYRNHIQYIPIAKKQSIPTIKNIFSISDGRELASTHLDGKGETTKNEKKILQTKNKTNS